MISNTLDWDLAYFVPHDYIQLLLKYFLPFDDRTQIHFHVHILLSIAICGKKKRIDLKKNFFFLIQFSF